MMGEGTKTVLAIAAIVAIGYLIIKSGFALGNKMSKVKRNEG